MNINRITIDPNRMGGVPSIRGLRIPVATVVGMVAEGISDAEILATYPDLELDDIREALAYSAGAVRSRDPQLQAALRAEPFVSEEELKRRALGEGYTTDEVVGHLKSL